MIQRQINATLFLQMMQEGAKNLHKHVETVNSLNVFPVPDGDTGTNMNLTLSSGVREMEKQTSRTLGSYAEALSKGLLMGARGNSGVILSQLFRGFSKSVADKMMINGRQLAEALSRGVQTAYKAVIKPVEGTILTVARQAAEAGVKSSWNKDDVVVIMETVIEEAKKTLDRTPQMLPVLKQAGVVDAGGQGLVYIFQGMMAALKGEIKVESDLPDLREVTAMAHEQGVHSRVSSEIEFGYCTEFIIRLDADKEQKKAFVEDEFKKEMARFGDSFLVIADEALVKVHIHAEYPGEVMTYAMNFGDLIAIKIDNMRAQNETLHEATLEETKIAENENTEIGEKEEKKFGIIAVASGAGIGAIFKSIGVDVVIEGGQSMNPSIEDMVKAINRVSAKHIFILPNNKNIILTAEQVQEVVNIPVTVLPTRTIPQGLSALLAFDQSRTSEENKQKMEQSYANIRSGEVTFAVRDSKMNDLTIKEGDVLGISEGKIETVGKDLLDTSFDLLEKMITDESEIISIIYGDNLQEEKANELSQRLKEAHPDIEVEIYNGGQPLYLFLFSVE